MQPQKSKWFSPEWFELNCDLLKLFINKLDIASSDFEQPTENMAHGMIVLCTLSYWYIVQVKCNNKWEC